MNDTDQKAAKVVDTKASGKNKIQLQCLLPDDFG
jgi:hypothetical protein